MLKADEIFRNIFNFSKSKLVGDTAKQQGFKDVINDFAGVAFVGGIVTGTYGMYKGTVKGIAKGASKLGKSIYGKVGSDEKEFINKKLGGKYGFPYGCEGRIDAIDDEIIDDLYKSNCVYLFVGLETGSERMQEISKKRLH